VGVVDGSEPPGVSGCGGAAVTPQEVAIARTVIYSSLFDYPITLDQLHESLLESRQTSDQVLETYRTSPLLQAMLEFREGLFFPRGRGALIGERRLREARSRAFLAVHRRLLSAICALPYVRMVALSGSIAHLNLERGADLDLFVVTRGRRVWSVTVAIVLLAKMMRRRRTVCANFVIADSELTLEQQDLFTANQVIHLKPICGADVIADLFAANPFVERFYPNLPRHVRLKPDTTYAPVAGEDARVSERSRLKAVVETVFARPSLVLERLCKWAYGTYLRARAGTWRSPEQVRLDAACLKLHTRSHRQATLERFDKAVWNAMDQGTALMNACSSENAGRFDQSGLTIAEPQSLPRGSSYKS
jgi:hypothetical protein